MEGQSSGLNEYALTHLNPPTKDAVDGIIPFTSLVTIKTNNHVLSQIEHIHFEAITFDLNMRI